MGSRQVTHVFFGVWKIDGSPVSSPAGGCSYHLDQSLRLPSWRREKGEGIWCCSFLVSSPNKNTVVWRSKGNLQFHLYNMSVGFWMLKWSTPSSTMEVWNGSLSENPFLYKQADHFSTPLKWGVKLKKNGGGFPSHKNSLRELVGVRSRSN